MGWICCCTPGPSEPCGITCDRVVTGVARWGEHLPFTDIRSMTGSAAYSYIVNTILSGTYNPTDVNLLVCGDDAKKFTDRIQSNGGENLYWTSGDYQDTRPWYNATTTRTCPKTGEDIEYKLVQCDSVRSHWTLDDYGNKTEYPQDPSPVDCGWGVTGPPQYSLLPFGGNDPWSSNITAAEVTITESLFYWKITWTELATIDSDGTYGRVTRDEWYKIELEGSRTIAAAWTDAQTAANIADLTTTPSDTFNYRYGPTALLINARLTCGAYDPRPDNPTIADQLPASANFSNTRCTWERHETLGLVAIGAVDVLHDQPNKSTSYNWAYWVQMGIKKYSGEELGLCINADKLEWKKDASGCYTGGSEEQIDCTNFDWLDVITPNHLPNDGLLWNVHIRTYCPPDDDCCEDAEFPYTP